MLEIFLRNAQLVLLYVGLSILMVVVGFLWYDLVMLRGHKLKKELFEDDNRAAGLVVGHYVIALVLVIAAVMIGDRQAAHLTQDLVLSGLYFLLALVLFTLIRLAYKVLMMALVKVDVDDEVFEQNNMAAARVEGAAYLSVGLILAAAIF